MELKMTECNYLAGSSNFFNDIVRFKNVIDYTRAILNAYGSFDDDFCDGQSCVDALSFVPRYFSVKFDDKVYVVVDGKLTDGDDYERIYELIDDMFAYAKDSHTFDFIQDDIKITVDIFEQELSIEF